MNTYTTFVSGWTRRTSAFIALAALSLGGCKSPDEFLSVTDPDIINPADVQSAAGADAVRLGALTRLNSSTSGPVTSTGGESLFLLGGLFSDEYNNGDSFIARQEVDQRIITIQNNFLTDANRAMHRARWSAFFRWFARTAAKPGSSRSVGSCRRDIARLISSVFPVCRAAKRRSAEQRLSGFAPTAAIGTR